MQFLLRSGSWSGGVGFIDSLDDFLLSRVENMWRWRRKHGSFQSSVGMPRIAATVLPLQLLKSVQPKNVLGSARLLQSRD